MNCGMTEDELQELHRHCTSNKTLLEQSASAGCFYCLRIFEPKEITEWINDKNGLTAVCPYCGIDSVLPGEIAELSEDKLKKMNEFWFGE